MSKPYTTGCTQTCNQGRDCTCVARQCESAAPEGGNGWFSEPEPVELTCWETITFYVCIALGLIVTSAIFAGMAGWIYGVYKLSFN